MLFVFPLNCGYRRIGGRPIEILILSMTSRPHGPVLHKGKLTPQTQGLTSLQLRDSCKYSVFASSIPTSSGRQKWSGDGQLIGLEDVPWTLAAHRMDVLRMSIDPKMVALSSKKMFSKNV